MSENERLLREAVDWILKDAAYKAPEQIGPVAARWIGRLREAAARAASVAQPEGAISLATRLLAVLPPQWQYSEIQDLAKRVLAAPAVTESSTHILDGIETRKMRDEQGREIKGALWIRRDDVVDALLLSKAGA